MRSIEEVEAMLATGMPPGGGVDPFVHAGLARLSRPWKAAVLWDADPRLAEPLIAALRGEPDLGHREVGDNEPYDGALAGDTINDAATSRGLANAVIEIRQDLIAERALAEAWAERLARLVKPLIAPPPVRIPRDFGTRAPGGLTARARPGMARRPQD